MVGHSGGEVECKDVIIFLDKEILYAFIYF